MVHFLWHMQAEHTFKAPVLTVVLHVFLLFLMIQFLVFHSCQPERLSHSEFLAGQREVSLGDMRQSLM